MSQSDDMIKALPGLVVLGVLAYGYVSSSASKAPAGIAEPAVAQLAPSDPAAAEAAKEEARRKEAARRREHDREMQAVADERLRKLEEAARRPASLRLDFSKPVYVESETNAVCSDAAGFERFTLSLGFQAMAGTRIWSRFDNALNAAGCWRAAMGARVVLASGATLAGDGEPVAVVVGAERRTVYTLPKYLVN